MDATLWGYLKRTESDGIADVERLRKSVSDVNGLFTLLWHPEAARMRGGRLYPSVLDGLKGDGCFVGSGSEIAGWWSARSAPLRREGGVYRMESAPEGMIMRFKAKGGKQVAAKGGMSSADGDSTVIEAGGGPITVGVV